MKIVRELNLQGESIALDNTRFVDCSFNGCTLEYSGGPVILERTALKRCNYLFSGAAKMTVELLDCVGLLPRDQTIAPANMPDEQAAALVH